MNKGHIQPGEVVNLLTLKEDMSVDDTFALVKTTDMEVIRMVLPEGKNISEHSVEGEMSVQCLKGHTEFTVGDTLHELTEGDWLYLNRNEKFSYHTKKETILLVTILFVNSGSESDS